ncbi:beta-glucoside-specific PTS transporter subunit IIABC [Candidatus Enterococcus mansonii]|uniref:PTS system sucrose-specific EIIBCA component n=1 Tax=Candidatus Enterococcus mansonii TaxID=1834181 RepID=A0A242CCK4_9ENTE|nr:beta-glucoside-specific PTS transporter subunit IIABC [Enterococcus sp. 4G2_DIV0659]OTO07977.1 hypothetical protein A5880_002247 [Enterococcus sp. 4G2_DIV0659]
MDAKESAKKILTEIGGAENILFITHCVTRLRFNLQSENKVDEEKLKKVPGVVGAVSQGGQYQVIIGQEVGNVYSELIKLDGLEDKISGNVAEQAPEEKKGIVNKLLDILAGIFTPIMPIIAGAGMLKALLSVLLLFNAIDKEGTMYYFLSFIADASYYFLPIFLAASAARKFKCNMQMAMLMGAILLHPNFIALKETGGFSFIHGVPIKIVTYSASVIPIILIVFVLSYVEKFVERITPSVVKFILKPVLTILIMAPISLIILGPMGSIIGDGIVGGLLAVEKVVPWILPTIIGAFMPYLVMTGMHYSLLPAYVNELAAHGYETVIGPGNLPSNIAQGAAALCVAIKTKNKEFRELAISSGVTALLGVTEPALFGVNLRLKRPLIATTIGGGLGGLYAGITGVQRFGGGGAGLAAIGLYIGKDSMNVINALISAGIAFFSTFVIQWYLGFDDIESEVPSKKSEAKKVDSIQEIYSPLDGTIIPLSEVPDPVFANEMMGKGVAILPKGNEVYAPVGGKIISIFETKHAIGIEDDNGAEVLIHIGLNTVELKGKYFELFVHVGDSIKVGDKLVSFSREEIEKEGYSMVTPIIVTNSANYEEVLVMAKGEIKQGIPLMTVY